MVGVVSKSALLRALRGLAVLCALAASHGAHAVCSAANQYTLNMSGQTATALTYASTPTYSAASTGLGSQPVSFSWTTNGLNAATGLGYPRVANNVNGGNGGNALIIGGTFTGRTASITGATRLIVTTIGFATLVRDATITVSDIDFSNNNWRDWVHIVGISASGSYVPAIVTPFSQSNGGTLTNASSSLTLGQTGVGVTPAATVQQAVGLSGATDTTNTGNLTMSFAQPVTSVQVRYGNYTLTGTETATTNQHMAFLAISYCPMPSLTVVKSSTPVDTVGNTRFNIPGADVYYSITVANSNSSPVDAGSIFVGDVLPANVTFYNGDIDGAGPLTGNFEFLPGTSGLSLTAANIAYANTPVTLFTYTPTAGYDTNVKAIRFAPTNAMASNSSFTVRFRARIK